MAEIERSARKRKTAAGNSRRFVQICLLRLVQITAGIAWCHGSLCIGRHFADGSLKSGDKAGSCSGNGIVFSQDTRIAAFALNDETLVSKRIVGSVGSRCRSQRRGIDLIATDGEDRIRRVSFSHRINLQSARSGDRNGLSGAAAARRHGCRRARPAEQFLDVAGL